MITKKDMLDVNNISVEELNKSGINVYTQLSSVRKIDPDLSTVIEDVRNLGLIMDAEDEAEEVAKDLEARLADLEEESAKIENEQTVLNVLNLRDNSFLSFDLTQPGFARNLFAMAKMVPVIPEGKSYTYEDIVKLNPDVIMVIIADTSAWGETDKEEVLEILSQPIFSDVPAVKNEKIIFAPYDVYMEYSLRAFEAAEELIDFALENE